MRWALLLPLAFASRGRPLRLLAHAAREDEAGREMDFSGQADWDGSALFAVKLTCYRAYRALMALCWSNTCCMHAGNSWRSYDSLPSARIADAAAGLVSSVGATIVFVGLNH